VHRTLTDAIGVRRMGWQGSALCSRYYTVTFRGHRIERIMVSGGGAYDLSIVRDQGQVGSEVKRPGLCGAWMALSAEDDESGEEAVNGPWLRLAFKGWLAQDESVLSEIREDLSCRPCDRRWT